MGLKKKDPGYLFCMLAPIQVLNISFEFLSMVNVPLCNSNVQGSDH